MGITSKTVDVKLRPGTTNLVPLSNGATLKIEPFRRNGRLYLRIFDAATGQKIKSISPSAKNAIETLLTSQPESQE